MATRKPVGSPGARPADEPVPARICPICGRPTVAEHRPFCSKRCREIDLHRWLNGTYAIPVVEEDGGSDDEA